MAMYGTSREAAWLTAAGAAILLFVTGGFALVMDDKDSLGLEVRASDGDGLGELSITNRNEATVTIRKLTINDRPECLNDGGAATAVNAFLMMGKSQTLKMGDQLSLASACKIIKARIETDKGDDVYTFD